ncbi:PIN domain-containing protein [Nostoc sp. KVJ20]|uniref:PIN domain-containing protein n=1 Tax=Nostoc sp. KVJ20 TaxID=457944 RepID=UPI00083D1691|nr:PIN domain-containing protein [Nostoc sp. KVJ20]
MLSFSVVLDSCVIYPMPLCDTLFRAAEAELYEIHFSQEILEGATRNLVKKGKMTDAKAARFQEMLKIHFPEAIVEVPEHLVASMTNHPGDYHVVAAAIVAKAKVIVTADLDDFPAEALKPWDIEAWHPDDFLVYLNDQFPGKMIQVIQQQSEDLKNPPMTIVELLDKLEKNNVTKFAGSICFHEYSDVIVQIAKTTLKSKFARIAPEGGRYFEGERYRLWQNRGVLTITAKDNRGEILRFQNGEIQGKLSSEDIKAFQLFEQSLEQQLEQAKTEKSQT